MKYLLIDPIARTVTEGERDNDYRNLYTLLTDEAHGVKVDCFTCLDINASPSSDEGGDTMFLDDEGLFKKGQAFFTVADEHGKDTGHRLAGRAIVLGTDDEGESISPRITLEALKARVTWLGAPIEGAMIDYMPPAQVIGFDSFEDLMKARETGDYSKGHTS